MLEGWDIKIDMNKGSVEHNIHCKPSVIAPNVEQETTQALSGG